MAAATQIAFYATTRSYAPVLAMHGFEDLVGPLRDAHGRGDFAKMTKLAMPMVGTLAAAGTAEQAREHVEAFEGVADRVILGGAWIGRTPERARESFELLLKTFGRRSWSSP
jgi:hypothetical protein